MGIIRNHHKALYQTTSFVESVSEVFWTCLIDDKIQLFIGFRTVFFCGRQDGGILIRNCWTRRVALQDLRYFVNTWGCQNGGTWSLSLSDQNSHGETKMVQKNMDDVLLEWVVIHVWEQHFLELRFSIKGLRIYHVDLLFSPYNELDNVAVAHGSENWRIKADGIKWCLDHTEGMKRFQRVYFPTRDAAGFNIARSSKKTKQLAVWCHFFKSHEAPANVKGPQHAPKSDVGVTNEPWHGCGGGSGGSTLRQHKRCLIWSCWFLLF